MKVRVTLSIDIDPEVWADTYAVEAPSGLRTDVQGYVLNQMLRSAAADAGAIRDVEVK